MHTSQISTRCCSYLCLLVSLLILLLFLLLLVVRDLLVSLLLHEQPDRVADELAVLLYDLLDALLLQILALILLDVEGDLGAATKGFAADVGAQGEATASRRLPDVLLVIIVLAYDDDAVRHEVARVEADAKLADHRDVGSGLEHNTESCSYTDTYSTFSGNLKSHS